MKYSDIAAIVEAQDAEESPVLIQETYLKSGEIPACTTTKAVQSVSVRRNEDGTQVLLVHVDRIDPEKDLTEKRNLNS